MLIIYSWYLTYPLSTVSANDFVFNHISILYWISLPLLFGSMFLMAVTTKSNLLKWLLSIGIVLTFFSLSYFYSMMSGGGIDSQFYRGLTEYFIKTKSLDPSQVNHSYYQWPGFFVLADVVTSVSGLSLASYGFLLYTIIGVLLATALYVYGTRKYTNYGIIVVAAYFIVISGYINYQAVPFSLALGLLFLLFMLETRKRSGSLIVTMLVLYSALLITHLFVAVFFVLYLLARSLFDKNSQNKRLYRSLFLITFIGWFIVQFNLARFSFDQIVVNITKSPVDSYSIIASNTFTSFQSSSSLTNTVNVTAQFFSRTVIIAFAGLCVAGLILLLIKRKMNALEKAILFTGVVYSGLGAVLNTLGWRAIAVAFIPFSLGAAFLFQGRFKRYLVGLFLVLLVLTIFVPLHQSFSNNQIANQTRENYIADNFFLNHYNWEKPSIIAVDFGTQNYLTNKLSVYYYISNQWLSIVDKADTILYTPQMVGLELGNYSSMESLSKGEGLNLLYNDGSSFVLIKPS